MNVIRGLNIILLTALLVFISFVTVFTDYLIEYRPILNKILQTLIIILIAYAINHFSNRVIQKQVQQPRERYSLRKAITTIISIFALGALIGVWIRETTTLIVAYGLLSAGVAIALQDVLKSIAGGIIIFFSGPFKAGDRIQVENEIGDVLDIKVFYTTLMEIREWVDGDQYSGRIIQIPNNFIISKTIKNYTRDFSFIWDEINLMFTYDSNWKKAHEMILRIANEVTGQFKDSAKKDLLHLGERYLITPADVEEKVYTKITDNWIDMRLRYVVDPRKRRSINHALNERLIEAFTKEKDIEIASATFEIVGFPHVTIDRNE